MWDELAKSDRSGDKLYVAEVKSNFQAEYFDPTKQTIQDFVARLDSHRTLIANIDLPITESDVLDKLFQLLPKGDPVWQAERHYCLRNNLDLQSTILQLKRIERPIPLQTTESSMVAKASHRGRDTRSKKAGNSTEKTASRASSKRHRSPSTSSSRSRSTSPSSSSRRTRPSVQCYFCEKRGHVQSECKEYKKAKNRLLGKEEDEDDKDKGKSKGSAHSAHYVGLINPYDEGSLS